MARRMQDCLWVVITTLHNSYTHSKEGVLKHTLRQCCAQLKHTGLAVRQCCAQLICILKVTEVGSCLLNITIIYKLTVSMQLGPFK